MGIIKYLFGEYYKKEKEYPLYLKKYEIGYIMTKLKNLGYTNNLNEEILSKLEKILNGK